jgi:hypothetical protein
MATTNNILIELANGFRLDYLSEVSLGIKLNRIVDDFNDPSKRFGDFSYTFQLPKTKNNDRIFEYPDSKGRIRIFKGKTFECNVYNNNQNLLSGIIELVGVDDDTYNCRFYSKTTQFIDEIKGKKLNDLTFFPSITWNYEQSIINHINVAPISPYIEFPLTFYKTPFIQGGTGLTTVTNIRAEANLGYYYNQVNSSVPFSKSNPMYEPAFPPAFYLKPILDAIFFDAGWTYNSSFFNRADIQKIIIPFVGSGEDFTGAITDGSPNDTLNLNKLLPKIGQAEFLKTILNVFNLYMIPDQANKSIVIETYNTLFSNNSNPYVVNVQEQSKNYLDTDNLITTKDDNNNELPLGFNRILDYTGLTATTKTNPSYVVNTCIDIRASLLKSRITTTYNKETYNNLWNKTTGVKEIKLSLSPTNYYPYCIINETSINGNTTAIPQLWTIGLPLISQQTPADNKGKDYSEGDQNFVEGNDPANFDYSGGFKLLYYYGKVAYNISVDGGLTQYKDWIYTSIAIGGTVTNPTSTKVPVCVASPFRLLDYKSFTGLTATANNTLTTLDKTGEAGAEVHSILLTFYGAGTSNDIHDPTSFSLTFGENPIYGNLFTEFHKKKYDDLENSYILKGTIRMNEVDWYEMQINRTLQWNDELYRLVAIRNFDPINRIAEIEMIKKT